MQIRVALCEDNADFRESLKIFISETPGYAVVADSDNARELITALENADADIVLMDIDMPGMNGIEATLQIKSRFPQLSVLMLTVYDDEDKVFNAILAGATGYILKKTPPDKILDAVKEVYEGGASMSASIVKRVLDFFQKQKPTTQAYQLSTREIDILSCLVNGDSYKMIADHCHISIGTVRTHITSIYKKLHINSKSEAVAKALKERLV